MTIADQVLAQHTRDRVTVLESQVQQLTQRLVALEKQSVHDNTLRLKDKKRGAE